MFRPILLRSCAALLGCVPALMLMDAGRAAVLIDEDFQDADVDETIDMIGWINAIPGHPSETGGPPVVKEEEDGNKFITTNSLNNQAIRYALQFTNPGFFSGTTLTITADMWDPFVNQQSSSSTFPRVVMGIYELAQPSAMPPYFGLETNDVFDQNPSDDPMTAEWVMSGENFGNPPSPTPRIGTAEGSGPAQDTWYTAKSEWNFSTGTMNLLVKERDSAGPFTEIFSDILIGFEDPDQNLAALDALQIRMLRGTRIDNIKVEYDVVMPPGTPGDYNDDGTVDAADYAVWRKNVGQMVTLPNDNTGVPTVGEEQYNLWQANFGNPSAGAALGAVAVPEPTALALVVFLTLPAARRRRRSVVGS